ncbi:PepSY domain-containing protein [Methylobacillus flagellatus]|uniref:PepSY domain-containing protein n=1 Tax=Methylobacillus flagellatus TaxID=405 RepID=UPI002853E1CE|nr:PepSY domain-containing protein [Methylobacillus flagellatus]MDR5172957.1 PepSY domain-containing protein [Methylobacillus flagellatus]
MKLFSMRNLHLWHRWLGIALGVLVLLWFISGAVMLFVAYPKLTQEERIPRLEAVAPGLVRIAPAQVAAMLGGELDKLRLAMHDGRPLYHALHQDSWHSVWADSGEKLSVTPNDVRISAQAFLPGASIINTELIERDQWSISSSLHAHRPLHRVTFSNGNVLYLSSRTAEVVLDTSRSERAWNWLGSVIHWIYFTPLRFDYTQVWRQVVMWLSFPATAMSLMGIWLGIDRLRLRRRYKGGRMTPYRGWAKWHHVSGLLAGVLCLTWLFSGWLSMKPFDMFSGKKLSEQESRHWAGKPPYGPLPALPAQIGATEKIGEIEWIYFAGRPILLGLTQHRTWMLDAASGAPLAPFAAAAFTAQAAGMLPHAGIKAATWLEHGDRYYYGKRLEAASPVIRIDLDDISATSYYIDPATTRIVASQDHGSRTYRWLFAALHRLDFAPLDNAEIPRWIVVILFSIGGVILTAAGMVMGWRRLTRA